MGTNPDDDLAVENFRTYLRIPSVQPDVDYTGCVLFLKKQAEEIGLEYSTFEFTPDKPIVMLTLRGTQPSLGSIILNSHMDVVTVSLADWHHDPFGAEMDEDGNIYGRGAQDTKELGIQYLEATRRLLKSGQKFLRNIHILFVPDEENGDSGMKHFVDSEKFKALNVAFTLDEGDANLGPEFNVYYGEKAPWHEEGDDPGMKYFVDSDDFKALNVFFALDEGGADPGTELLVFYGEKAIWHVTFHVRGTEGHGSLDLRNTAGEKLRRLLDQIMDYRQGQLDMIDSDPSLSVSDVTFINFTETQGGAEPNVVPSVLSATFDIRLAVTEDQDKMTALLEEWASKAGGDIDIDYILKEPVSPATPIDGTNPFWTAMKQTLDQLGEKIDTRIMAGGTDGRFLRRNGIRVLSFSPINNTPDLAHANDEYLNKDVFLRGIQIFTKIIPAIANIPTDP